MTAAPDVSRIFEIMLESARNDLIGSKELRLAKLFAFQPDGSLTIFALDIALFSPDGTKQRFGRQLRERLLRDGFAAYGFYTEVWISRRTPEDGKGRMLPEQDPDRDEALMLIVGTRERGFVRRYRMARRRDGTVRRLSELPYDPDDRGGRFGALLAPEAWDGKPQFLGMDDAVPVDPGGSLRH